MTESTWILLCAVVVFLIASMVLLIYFIIWLYRLPETKLPLNEIIRIPNLSCKDNIRILVVGFLPFMGYILMPTAMKSYNINDYYEMRYNFLRERKNSEATIKADLGRNATNRRPSILDLLIYQPQPFFDYNRSFNYVRFWVAACISLISLIWYLNNTTLIYSYISYFFCYHKGHIHASQISFTDVIVYTQSQIQLPIFESQFIQSAWWLVVAIIGFNRAIYWNKATTSEKNKFDSRLV